MKADSDGWVQYEWGRVKRRRWLKPTKDLTVVAVIVA